MKNIYYVVCYLDENDLLQYEAFEEKEVIYSDLKEQYEIVLNTLQESKEKAIEEVKKYKLRYSKGNSLKRN